MSQNVFVQYLAWHFWESSRGIGAAWRNCLKFNLNHWSVPLLVRTWFSPWRRYRSSYGRGFSFSRYFEVFTLNMTSRALGAVMRTVLIIIGFLTEILVFLAGGAVFLLWLMLPFLLIFGFIYGCKILL